MRHGVILLAKKSKSMKMEMACDHASGCCCGDCGECGSGYDGYKKWKVGKLIVGLVLLASALMPATVPLQWAVGLLGLWMVVKTGWKLMKGW